MTKTRILQTARFNAGRAEMVLDRAGAPKPCGGEVNSGKHFNLYFHLSDTSRIASVRCKACNYERLLERWA